MQAASEWRDLEGEPPLALRRVFLPSAPPRYLGFHDHLPSNCSEIDLSILTELSSSSPAPSAASHKAAKDCRVSRSEGSCRTRPWSLCDGFEMDGSRGGGRVFRVLSTRCTRDFKWLLTTQNAPSRSPKVVPIKTAGLAWWAPITAPLGIGIARLSSAGVQLCALARDVGCGNVYENGICPSCLLYLY